MLAVVDYGIGNVRSVLNALDYVGAAARLTHEPAMLAEADGLVLPGVGAFGEGMSRLRRYGLDRVLEQYVAGGRPVLGICLGFQMLMRSSTELGEHDGLGLMPYDVVRLPVAARLPHIGWSPVVPDEGAPPPRLLNGLAGELFYFVHSYGVVRPKKAVASGIAQYEDCEFLGYVEDGNVFGAQFHPEKSGEAGLQMLRNFNELAK